MDEKETIWDDEFASTGMRILFLRLHFAVASCQPAAKYYSIAFVRLISCTYLHIAFGACRLAVTGVLYLDCTQVLGVCHVPSPMSLKDSLLRS